MGLTKKKSDAEATANLIDRDKYIMLRNQMQGGTHVARLFDYLWTHDSITPAECFDKLGNTRIGSTVSILRHRYDVPIKTKTIAKKVCGKTIRYGSYSIERSEKNVQM